MSELTRNNTELPPPLMTSEMGSFARRTIVERKPQIIQQVIEDNDYPPGIVGAAVPRAAHAEGGDHGRVGARAG